MKIIDGQASAEQVIESIRAALPSFRRPPGLAVILVGDDPVARTYARNKSQQAEQLGFHQEHIELPWDVSERRLQGVIDRLNNDPEIDGILVQLPLPEHIDACVVFAAIHPLKDVDGNHPENRGWLALGQPRHIPCTPKGILRLLDSWTLLGMEAVVVGASNTVGRPTAVLLEQQGCTVTVCHKLTMDLREHVERAELLVVGTGVPHLIKGEWIQDGAIVIDVGITRMADGSLVGDVEFDVAKDRAYAITPVPGGVGPMTVAMVMENTALEAARNQGIEL